MNQTMKHTFPLLLFLLLGTVLAVRAANESIQFRTMQVTDGLSNNHVNTIFRDSQGFMWFGTASGLNRYDGFSIKAFQSNPADSLSLHDNYVQSIQEDRQHRLWICAGDVYAIFNPETEEFHRLSQAYYKELGMKAAAQVVSVDGDDLWLWARNDGLYHASKGHAARLMPYDRNREVTAILVDDSAHRVYVAENNGAVAILDRRSGRMTQRLQIPQALSRKLNYSFFLDSRKRLWVYSEYGTCVYDTVNGQWLGMEVQPAYKSSSVKAINEDAEGNIWIGYDNDGVEVKMKDGTSLFLRSNINDPHSLGNDSVESIFHDSDGGMWVATYKRGVSVYYPSEYKFQTYALGDVNCIIPVPGVNQVYVGTDHGELTVFDLQMHVSRRITVPEPYGSRAITAMATGRDGTLWVGTYKGGMYGWRNGEFRHFDTGSGLSSPNVWSLVTASDGNLWIGTLGGGVQRFNPDNGAFDTFNVQNSGLTSDYISSLTLGRDGNIYAGCADGVAVINPVMATVNRLDGFRQQGSGYGSLNINQLMCDSRGLLWIGSREGLFVYDLKTDAIFTPQLRAAANNLFINGIVEGADGTVWITSGSTLYNVSVDGSSHDGNYRFNSYAFGVEDGLSGTSFNQRSLCLAAGGQILAGYLGGILEMNPDKLQYAIRYPTIRFTELTIGNTPVRIGQEYDGRVILPKALSYMHQLKLGARQNDITISFSTDSYQHSSREVFEYMLEGYDDAWRQCPRGINYVHYMKLPSGHYTLKVRLRIPGVDADRIMGELKITVAVPWYASWWMIVIYALVAAGVILMSLWLVRRRERRRYMERQRRETERKEMELNEMKFKFFTNVSHDLRTPLTLILSPVESLLSEKTDEHDVRRLNTIKRNANRLLYLVNQLLDMRKKDMAGLHLNLSSGDVVQTVEKAMESFMDIADRRDIDLKFSSEQPSIMMAYDVDKVTKCVMNLLSNAVKYTPDHGTITVGIRTVDGKLEITVADTGKGVSDKDKQHIFERFYMGDDKSGSQTGTGIGLSLVFEYVKLHGGEVHVEDNKPCGAVFRLTLPMDLKAEVPDIDQEGDTQSAETAAGDTSGLSTRDHDAGKDATYHRKDADKPRILFVDDNVDLTEFLRDEFGREYDVDTAPDGEDAEQMVKENRYDLIVTDIMMPKVDGIQLTRALKADPETANIPVIMLTAKQDVSSVVEGLSLGADDYVTKPFNNDVLALKIKRMVSLSKGGIKRSYIEPTPENIEITSLDQQLIGKAVKYVEDNMDRTDLTVEELSRELGMSRVHLYKKLLALTGKSPIEFIRILRLKRAAQYLRESQMNVSEIAYQVGFNNPKYFSRYFKEEYGMTPSEYEDNMMKQG